MIKLMKRSVRIFVCMVIGDVALASGVPDTPFWQEYHEAYNIRANGAANDVRAVAIDHSGALWAATGGGLYVLHDGEWSRLKAVTDGPIYDVEPADSGAVWVGAWNGLYCIQNGNPDKVDGVEGAVSTVAITDDGIIAMGPDGSWRSRDGVWSRMEQKWSRNVRDILAVETGELWIATGMGLYRLSDTGLRHHHRGDELVSGELTSIATAPDGRVWIGSLGGIDVYENGVRVDYYTSEQGLPHYDVRSLTFDPDGRLWVGTALGVARFDGETWSLRHSRRWLLSNDVRDVAFDREGTAWVATGGGVSAIKRKRTTLAEKADHYLDICLKRHVRPPGLVEKCYFPDPSNHEEYRPRDDDNDGQYTSMYLAMESFRYAVTEDPEAKANADNAYNALEFLQTVTGTEGFVARTVVPSDWTEMADPNEEISPKEAAERRVRDPRYKIVPTRWRPSKDGQWLWKGDTSSDEITGHFSGYYFYYELAADANQKERVRRHVRKIMDYIIDGGYVLRDIDGKATRWGVWSPEKLHGDPDWRVECPINSFEILSFLKTTYHITGDAKYQQEYEKLIRDHNYAENVRRPKAYGLSERTHIDDELLMLAAPGLILTEDDPYLRSIYMEGVTWAYRTVENDQNPYFNFTFGLLGGENFHLDESIEFLRDTPLDLVQWRVDNSKREDIALVRRPMLEPLQLERMPPPSERGVMRWDKNPWEAISGDFSDTEGHLESCGVFWLLPYWMGRYCGFIQE